MPANLTAEAKAKWNKVVLARSPEEKLEALREFLSAIPKHKGNERLRAQVKKRIASLKVELGERRRGGKAGGAAWSIERGGAAAQIAILGLTNAGKSSLLAALTNAKPEVSPRPYSTREPIPGTMLMEDLRIQLIEAPALIPGAPNVVTLNLAKRADGLILVVDASSNPRYQMEAILEELSKVKIAIEKPKSKIDIERRGLGGLQIAVFGELVDCSVEDVKKLLLTYGVRKGTVKIWGRASLKDVEDGILEVSNEYKPAVVVLNKIDLAAPGELPSFGAPTVQVSCLLGRGLNAIGPTLVKTLGIIRVYTKEPGEKEASKEPVILKEGDTVADLARKIHSELYKNFKYARVWGPSSNYPGEKVGEAHALKDGDIVEIRAG